MMYQCIVLFIDVKIFNQPTTQKIIKIIGSILRENQLMRENKG